MAYGFEDGGCQGVTICAWRGGVMGYTTVFQKRYYVRTAFPHVMRSHNPVIVFKIMLHLTVNQGSVIAFWESIYNPSNWILLNLCLDLVRSIDLCTYRVNYLSEKPQYLDYAKILNQRVFF